MHNLVEQEIITTEQKSKGAIHIKCEIRKETEEQEKPPKTKIQNQLRRHPIAVQRGIIPTEP